MMMIKNFVLFSRPHTVIGTLISISALYLIAGGDWWDWKYWMIAIMACLGANIYIVGLNQLTDIEIDIINKPYLPLASGAYSQKTARWVIGVSLFISLLLGVIGGGFLLATILISIMLGTMYSLPPVRLKRFYFWAAFCIIAIRGLTVNLLMYLHFSTVITGSPELPALIWWLTGVIFIYSIVIAWFKDIPDMAGDQHFKINTLSLKMGPKKVFKTGIAILSMAMIAVIVMEWIHPVSNHPKLMFYSHIVFLITLWMVSARTKISDHRSIKYFYQFIWVLFFCEYIVFALSQVLN